jgi:uncharacterized protein YraI
MQLTSSFSSQPPKHKIVVFISKKAPFVKEKMDRARLKLLGARLSVSVKGRGTPGEDTMTLLFRQLGLALTLFFILFALQACEKKEAREPDTVADSSEQTQPYTTTDDVKVRSGPGTRYKIIAEIKSGMKVNVVGRERGWLRVVSKKGNPPGYIDERFAKPATGSSAQATAPAQGTYITIADAYVRESPGLHYKAVAKIEKGKEVNVVGEEGDWLKVQSLHGRPPGYIEKRYAERRPD